MKTSNCYREESGEINIEIKNIEEDLIANVNCSICKVKINIRKNGVLLWNTACFFKHLRNDIKWKTDSSQNKSKNSSTLKDYFPNSGNKETDESSDQPPQKKQVTSGNTASIR